MRAVHHLFRPRAAVVTALAYALALGLADLVVHAQPPRTTDAWLRWCSTDLDNLASHPIAALVASAFVTDDSALPWVGLAVVGLWACVRVLGGNRSGVRLTVGAVAAVHVLATLASEGVLALRIALGDEPGSARQLLDIGPSYLVVAALVVAVTAGRGLERIVCAAGFVVVAPSLFEGLDRWDVAALGHATAIVLAVGCGLVQRRRLRRAG